MPGDESQLPSKGPKLPPRTELKQSQPQGRLKKHSSSVFGVVGVLIGGFFSWLFTWMYYSEVKPVYAVSTVEAISNTVSPKLSLNWEGSRIENVCVQRIALWNDGS